MGLIMNLGDPDRFPSRLPSFCPDCQVLFAKLQDFDALKLQCEALERQLDERDKELTTLR
jgi:hypothetical protein